VITFNNWLVWSLPYSALSAVVAYATFVIMYKLMAPNEVEVVKERLRLFEATREVRKGLSRSEVLGLIGILILICLWVTDSIHGIKTEVSGMIGLLAMLALGVLKPMDIKDLGWDIVILMGGGLILGKGLMDTGFSDVVTQLFATYMRSSQLLVWLVGFVSLMLGTFISSHTAGVAFICPIIAPLGYVIGPSIGLSPEAGNALLTIFNLVYYF
jgi:sodium-dependent dicarboxylate transporter 2/3/5